MYTACVRTYHVHGFDGIDCLIICKGNSYYYNKPNNSNNHMNYDSYNSIL